jgi:hypothetical protein
MNKRGSALVNVLAVIVVLMIVGVSLMQIVSADTVTARRDQDGAFALQMAEGGIDFGIDLLNLGPTKVLGENMNWPGYGMSTTPFVVDLGGGDTVEVSVEQYPSLDGTPRFIVTSTATKNSSTRKLQAVVAQFHGDGQMFPYSLFVAGNPTPVEPQPEWDLILNMTIEGSVLIGANRVRVDNGTKFLGSVHFRSDYVWIHSNTEFDARSPNIATHDPHTEVFVAVSNQNQANRHWTRHLHSKIDATPFPNIPIVEYATKPEFYVWNQSVVNFADLKEFNYFPGDVTLWLEKDKLPIPNKVVIACNGTVNFDAASNFQFNSPRLTYVIIMAEKDIIGVEKLANKGSDKKDKEINLYMYAKGSIITGQNIVMSSVMAQVVSFHNNPGIIKAPDPRVFDSFPQYMRDHWKVSGFRIERWTN